MQTQIQKANETFLEACKLKDEARVTRDRLEIYEQAAECFKLAGGLAAKVSSSDDTSKETATLSKIFSHYYFYEEQQCRLVISYERHDINKAREQHGESVTQLNHAIEMANSALRDASPELTKELMRNICVWSYYLHSSGVEFLSIEAREALDGGELIRALDCYRTMLPRLQKLIEAASNPQLDKTYHRIAVGNYFGTQVNASQALAKICFDRSEHDVLPADLGDMFLQELFAAYKFGLTAFRNNPEYDHYRTDSAKILSDIKEFLVLNKDAWMNIFLLFEDDREFLAIMKAVDMKRYKEIEAETKAEASKAVRLWQYGGFVLLSSLIVLGAIFLLLTHSQMWWQLAFSIIGFEVLLLFIGTLTLRSVGDLSEEGMVTLVKVALQQQFKVFSALKGLIVSSPKKGDTNEEKVEAE